MLHEVKICDFILVKFSMKIRFAIFLILASMVTLSSCSSSSYKNRYGETEPEIKEIKAKEISKDKMVEKKYENPPKNEVINNDVLLDKENFTKKLNLSKKLKIPLTVREKLLFEIITFLETPYQWGGNSFTGVDCSGLTRNIYNNALTLSLPRTVSEQYAIGEKIEKTSELLFGDLVFFNTSKDSFPGHVGIFIGDNKFIHSGQSTGVIVNSIDEVYYKERFVGARRIVPES